MKKVKVTIDGYTLRTFPELNNVPEYLDAGSADEYLEIINKSDKFKAKFTEHGIKIEPKVESEKDFPIDKLGLPLVDKKLKDICDSLSEDTNRDPRRFTVYSRGSFAAEGIGGVSATERPFGLSGKKQRPHPLDRIQDEDIVKRREAFDRQQERPRQKVRRTRRKTNVAPA